jgi:hypothetical protein
MRRTLLHTLGKRNLFETVSGTRVACLIAQASRQAFWVLRASMRIVLMRKLANSMDGVDVSDRQVGDVLDLPAADAHALVAEQWAIFDRRDGHPRVVRLERRRATDGTPSSSRTVEPTSPSAAPQVVPGATRVEPA